MVFYKVQALYRMIEFNKNIGALYALQERPKIKWNCLNKNVLTLLHIVILKNWEFAVKLLMDRSDLDVNATADFDLTPLHQRKMDKIQLQKSFANLSYANTILLCNPGATNLTNTSGSIKKQHETPNLRLILKTR
jgi:hypothetical protein